MTIACFTRPICGLPCLAQCGSGDEVVGAGDTCNVGLCIETELCSELCSDLCLHSMGVHACQQRVELNEGLRHLELSLRLKLSHAAGAGASRLTFLALFLHEILEFECEIVHEYVRLKRWPPDEHYIYLRHPSHIVKASSSPLESIYIAHEPTI